MPNDSIQLPVGLTGEARCVVQREHCATTWASGALEVFSTPHMIALMENAAFHRAQEELPDGFTTVGTEVRVAHLAACPPGHEVTATAVLESQDGRRLLYRVTARSGEVLLGEGYHERAIVNEAKMLERLAARWGV